MNRARPTVVILGAGFAGLRALYRLRDLSERAELVIIDTRLTSVARPALPEVALAGKPVDHARFPVRDAVARHGARFVHRAVGRVEAGRSRIVFDDGGDMRYDALLVALGADKDYDAIPGFGEFGYSVCDDTEAPRLAAALEGFEGGPVVIGSAKSTWGSRVEVPQLAAPCEGPVAEIMFMVDYELRRRGLRDASPVRVFSPGAIFFEDVGPKVHADVEPLVARQGIEVTTAKVLDHLSRRHVHFRDGTSWDSALSIVLPPYSGNPVVKASPGLGDEQGFVPTDTTMRHLDFEHVYAAGDAAALSMPKLGHIAVMEAAVAAAAIRQDLTGEGDVPPHRPEVFCIANRGGHDATLIYSDTLYGGSIDLTPDGVAAHLMKWSFDSYYFHTKGHLPPDLATEGLETILRKVRPS
ncbi:MAG: FAD-dependent oxidoreductase [Actinomycetota bacterium]|jgi:sulfide:quinone oxidoreductase|nr:FAD-dependent oxidoreductase [Actinomycetota bacterium]